MFCITVVGNKFRRLWKEFVLVKFKVLYKKVQRKPTKTSMYVPTNIYDNVHIWGRSGNTTE